MDSARRPTHHRHVVCVPFPLQGHINPMMKLAKIIHHRGFHITFVNTDFNHRRLLRARPSSSLPSLPRFHFETIPDGLPISDKNSTQDLSSLCKSTSTSCLPHFRDLLLRLNSSSSSPPVSVIISDTNMFFTLQVAQEFSIPNAFLFTCNATTGVCCIQYPTLIDRGITPFKDSTGFTNGNMDTVIDWIPGIDRIRIRDIPTFIRATDPDDIILRFTMNIATESARAAAIIINTFQSLEKSVLDSFATLDRRVYAVGPLHMMAEAIVEDESVRSMGSNLWKEDDGCLQWLDNKKKGSVVYINYGSITVMTEEQLGEFAWGLADSMSPFLWIIRPDLVGEEGVVELPPEFVERTKERGMITSWCDQERVLKHGAVGGFLTHSGWNSTLESIDAGVPIICWPFFADQQTNCFLSEKWGIGAEIGAEVKRKEVEKLVRELMEGERGRRMREKIMCLKKEAMAAISPGGSSFSQMDAFMEEILMARR